MKRTRMLLAMAAALLIVDVALVEFMFSHPLNAKAPQRPKIVSVARVLEEME